MIRYFLVENNLTPDPDDHVAGVQPISTKTMDDVADKMVSRGSTVTKAEVLSVMEEFILAIAELLRDGHNVTTPMGNLSVSMSGVFANANDAYDPARHTLSVRITRGVRLRDVLDRAKVERIPAVKPMPVLQSFKDTTSNTESDTLTPGGVGTISGSVLKFNPADATQGVFFTATNGTVTKVETIVSLWPSEVIFVIPATLVAGEYSLSVRTMIKGAKDLREGFLVENLVVR